MSNIYYTYLLVDPRTNEIFYVGKGQRRRMYQHKLDVCSRFNPSKQLHLRIREILDAGHEIKYEKVLINTDEAPALNKERELILEFGRVDIGTGSLLNETAGGEGSFELSKSQLKKKRERSSKPVSQYDLDSNFISHFPSAKFASEVVPTANRSYITQVCKGKRQSAGGFLWTYKGDPLPTFSKKYHKSVQQFSVDGILLNTFRSLTEAQNITGVELHNISECCRGKSKTAGGFIWNYHI